MVVVKNYDVYSNLTKQDPLSTQKALSVSTFVNLKIEYLQKIKTMLFMKSTVVTLKKSTSVNLNGL